VVVVRETVSVVKNMTPLTPTLSPHEDVGGEGV
jgi:hypothetical protein